MSKSTIQIPKHPNSKSAQRLTDLRITRKATRGEEVDEVAGEGYQDHDGGLLPFCLVDGAEAHSEEGDEEEADLGVMSARGHCEKERLGEGGGGSEGDIPYCVIGSRHVISLTAFPSIAP